MNQEVIMGMLEHIGYSADMVSDGRSALLALHEIPYTLVLADCELPEMDGYELSRLIRNPSTNVLNPQIPIIAVTAHSLAGDRESVWRRAWMTIFRNQYARRRSRNSCTVGSKGEAHQML